MATVPDHLTPQDGLSNADIKFTSFEAAGTGAIVYFTLFDESGDSVGEFPIEVHPSKPDGSIDQLVADAHRQMLQVLRQWIHRVDVGYRAYETRGARDGR